MRAPDWVPAYVGLGSNLGDPVLEVGRGFDALARLPETRLVARSSLYRSRPLGPVQQPDFVNAAAGLLTCLEPLDLLRRLKALEVQLGRARPVERWGPRLIDFDLLLYGAEVIETAELVLPHAGLRLRNWVLWPLADIAPTLAIPGGGDVRQLAGQLGTDGLVRIAAGPDREQAA